MKRSIVILTLTLFTVLSALANEEKLNCESFETIRMRDCSITYYDESDDSWSLTLPSDVESTIEKFGSGENAVVRETTALGFGYTKIHDYGIASKLVTSEDNFTTSSKWIECSPKNISMHIVEVVTSENGKIQTIYKYRSVLNVLGNKVELKNYLTGKYQMTDLSQSTSELDPYNGRPKSKLNCSLF
jgi:hypothetical protein